MSEEALMGLVLFPLMALASAVMLFRWDTLSQMFQTPFTYFLLLFGFFGSIAMFVVAMFR